MKPLDRGARRPNHQEMAAGQRGIMSSIVQAFERIVGQCCEELFRAYGVELARDHATYEGEMMLCGILGFTGTAVRGAIILAGGEGPFIHTNPIPGSPERTWCAELTNQLVGRVKNALVTRGVEIHLSTPVVLRGAHLAPLPRLNLPPLSFRDRDDVLCVWIELDVDPDLIIGEPFAEVVAEGDTILF
jgi:hypothetical protein